MNKTDIGKLLGIDGKKYKILSINTIKEKDVTYHDIYIEKKNTEIRCPDCGIPSTCKKDKLKYTYIKHGYIKFVQCRIVFRKQRYYCKHCNKKFVEIYDIVEKRGKVSKIVKIEIRRKLLNINLTLKEIARECGVSDTEVKNELLEMMNEFPKVSSLKGVKVLSFDEYSADTEFGKYACILNDPVNKRTLDILETRKKDYLMNYLRDVKDRNNVEYVVSDMYDTYLSITKKMFPNAKYVVDRFHYTRCSTIALDKVRIRFQDYFARDSKEYKILKKSKNANLYRKHGDDVNWFKPMKYYQNKRTIMRLPGDILRDIFNIHPELEIAYNLKEMFLDIVETCTYKTAEEELKTWIDLCRESGIEEFIEASNTINNWLEYICNSFIDRSITNAFTEGRNNQIKIFKRVSNGVGSFKYMRLRLLYIFNKHLINKTTSKKSTK